MINKSKIKKAAKPLVTAIQGLKLRKVYEDGTKTVYQSGKDQITVPKKREVSGKTSHRFR